MSALLNGVPLNGGNSTVWAEGHSTGEVDASAVPYREVPADGAITAEAIQTSIADRTAWAADVVAAATAEETGVSERHARVASVSQGEALETAGADRTAWMVDTTGMAEASETAVSERWRLATATLVAEAESTTDEALTRVIRVTHVRDTRGVAQTVISEDYIERILVNQVYTSATCIARARTSGLANTQIAFGTAYAEAGEIDDNLLVNLNRDARAEAIGESAGETVPHQIHVIQGTVPGEAFVYVAPDILRADGSNERYAWGVLEGIAEDGTVNGLAERTYFDENIAAESTSQVDDTFFTRGVQGLTASTAEGQAQGRVNQWVQAQSVCEAVAVTDAVGDRLAWVGAFGASDTYAESTSGSTRYRLKYMTDTAIAEATSNAVNRVFRPAVGDMWAGTETTGVPYKLIKANSITSVEGESAAGTVVYHWTWAAGECVGEAASNKAHALRDVIASPVKPIYGEATLEKLSFYINASDPAPDDRTIYLFEDDRFFVLPESNREIVIS